MCYIRGMIYIYLTIYLTLLGSWLAGLFCLQGVLFMFASPTVWTAGKLRCVFSDHRCPSFHSLQSFVATHQALFADKQCLFWPGGDCASSRSRWAWLFRMNSYFSLNIWYFSIFWSGLNVCFLHEMLNMCVLHLEYATRKVICWSVFDGNNIRND